MAGQPWNCYLADNAHINEEEDLASQADIFNIEVPIILPIEMLARGHFQGSIYSPSSDGYN